MKRIALSIIENEFLPIFYLSILYRKKTKKEDNETKKTNKKILKQKKKNENIKRNRNKQKTTKQTRKGF